jgi:hypothetical protein
MLICVVLAGLRFGSLSGAMCCCALPMFGGIFVLALARDAQNRRLQADPELANKTPSFVAILLLLILAWLVMLLVAALLLIGGNSTV